MNVLVVDDKKSVRDNLSTYLQARGYNVDTAVNGLDGFEKAQQGQYQLFVIDHLMPLMNGVLLSKNIKQTEQYNKTPIVFITTQPADTVKNLPEFSLFEQVVNKPINESEFISTVSLLLSNGIQANNTSSIAL
jgi:two-component system chemotaxis response regulator CheY